MRTLPFEPLMSLLDGRDDATIADLVGVHRTSITKWRRKGQLPLWSADLVAIRLGSHPTLIWPAFDPRHVR